ncbi:MAG: hypothetical protein K2F65_07610 [Eubacterium sp.]|nr:hypothetical protein [Eubacterium sp.]
MKKINKKSTSIIIILCVLFTLLCACSSKANKYDDALIAMNNEEWDIAISLLTGLEYEDSQELLEGCIKEKGMHEKADYEFLEAIGESVMKRYQKSENGDSIESCINIELEILSKFKEAEFYDEELRILALEYISGVELQKKSLSESNGGQQLPKEEGYVKRLNALKKLTDNYGLLEDNVDYKATYYNKVDDANKEYEALKAIENDLSLFFDKLESSDWIDETTQRIVIKNNTKYDYDMKIFFTYYDKNGVILDTWTGYYENIKSKTKYNIDFYYPLYAVQWNYYTEEYNIKENKES